MKILILIDDSRADLAAGVEAACAGIEGAEISVQTGRSLPDGDWQAVLVTPGADGLGDDLKAGLKGRFSVEVQPENTHADSTDHAPSGTDAILLGAGAGAYALAVRTCLARAA